MFPNRLLGWFAVLGLAVLWGAADDGCAQSWQDPALQQPVPQYYSPNRYPLGGPSEKSTSMDKPLDMFVSPESTAFPAVKANPAAPLLARPPAIGSSAPIKQLSAPKKDVATEKTIAKKKQQRKTQLRRKRRLP